jgi:hypothetical protein
VVPACRPRPPTLTSRGDRMSFRLSFHLGLLDRTGAHSLDGPPDVTCMENSRQYFVDGSRLSCNPLLATWGRCSSRAQSAMRHQMEYLVTTPQCLPSSE